MTNAGRGYNVYLNSQGNLDADVIFDMNERFANDIARAIANNGSMTVLSRADAAQFAHGYSQGDPKLFLSPGNGGGGGEINLD